MRTEARGLARSAAGVLLALLGASLCAPAAHAGCGPLPHRPAAEPAARPPVLPAPLPAGLPEKVPCPCRGPMCSGLPVIPLVPTPAVAPHLPQEACPAGLLVADPATDHAFLSDRGAGPARHRSNPVYRPPRLPALSA